MGTRLPAMSLLTAIAVAPACRAREASAQGGVGPPPAVLGTFEKGNQSQGGFAWVPVTDRVTGGISTAQVEVVEGGAAGTRQALAITGKVVLEDFPFPFAGTGLRLADGPDGKPRPVDVSGYQGIQFWAKGDGKQYMLRLLSPEVKDHNFHHFPFQAGPEWSLHRVPFSSLSQFRWGKRIPFPGKSLLAVSFLNYSAPGEAAGAISLLVDEVAFY